MWCPTYKHYNNNNNSNNNKDNNQGPAGQCPKKPTHMPILKK